MKKTVLLVDDQDMVLNFVKLLVKSILPPDWEIRCVRSVVEAVIAIPKIEIGGNDISLDLVITDFDLEDGKGSAIVELAKKVWPECKTMIMSGDGTGAAEIAAEKVKADMFLKKPFNAANFKEAVKQLSHGVAAKC